MNPAILVLANLGLFVLSVLGGFAIMHILTHKLIGFFHGARFAVFTPEDAASRRKHRLMLGAILITLKVMSSLALVAFGPIFWASYTLSVSIGLGLGALVNFHMNKGSLLPKGWKRQD